MQVGKRNRCASNGYELIGTANSDCCRNEISGETIISLQVERATRTLNAKRAPRSSFQRPVLYAGRAVPIIRPDLHPKRTNTLVTLGGIQSWRMTWKSTALGVPRGRRKRIHWPKWPLVELRSGWVDCIHLPCGMARLTRRGPCRL